MDKITIERETLLPCPFCGDDGDKGRQEVTQMIEGRNKFARITCRACGAMCPEENWNRRAALAQKAEPPSMPQGKSLALLDLDSVEHMQGGANGPTIRLRGFINAQTGPTAPQPPIDNAFVAEGCEQFSPPSEPAPVPCCGKYETCSHACTPRGKWLGRREGRRVLAIVPPGYVLVPIDPTDGMLAAMQSSGWMVGNYRAMIAAAGDKP